MLGEHDRYTNLGFQCSSSTGESFAETSVIIKAQPDDTPTGAVKRVCPTTPCPERHTTGKPLVLLLQLDAGFENAVVTWSSSAVDLAGVATNTSQFVIPVAKLPVVGAVNASASFKVGNKTGVATLVVPVDGAPYCSDGSNCLAATVATGANDTFPDAVFSASAPNIIDDATLM
jgi:hypothetical protein